MQMTSSRSYAFHFRFHAFLLLDLARNGGFAIYNQALEPMKRHFWSQHRTLQGRDLLEISRPATPNPFAVTSDSGSDWSETWTLGNGMGLTLDNLSDNPCAIEHSNENISHTCGIYRELFWESWSFEKCSGKNQHMIQHDWTQFYTSSTFSGWEPALVATLRESSSHWNR